MGRIRLRRTNYEPLLPQVDAKFRELDSQMRLRVEQRDHLQKRLQDILTAPRPELLATASQPSTQPRARLVRLFLSGVNQQNLRLQMMITQCTSVLTARTQSDGLIRQHKQQDYSLRSALLQQIPFQMVSFP